MRQRHEDEAARNPDESTQSSGVSSEPRPGCRLDRYELLRLYARGGMGSLWAARQLGDHGFEKRVAIKTLRPHLAGQPQFREMFLGEAKMASRIDHPNVARVLDLVERSDLLYLVMEWIDGCSLAELGGHLAPRKDERGTRVLLRILADACAGLHAAHELRDPEGAFLSVVHRDVSPRNILVDRHGVAKIIDFGIAKATGATNEDTDPEILKGKFAYMAPEYVDNRQVDRRADVWAIGVILHRYVTGKSPFELDEPTEKVESVSRSLAAIVDRAMMPNPDDRYATAADLRDALEGALAELGGSVSSRVVADFVAMHAPASVGVLETNSAGDRAVDSLLNAPSVSDAPKPQSPRRTTRRAAFVAAGALCLCAGALVFASIGASVVHSTPTATPDQVAVEVEPNPCPVPAANAMAEEPGETSAVHRAGESSGKAKPRPSIEAHPPVKPKERSAVLDFGI